MYEFFFEFYARKEEIVSCQAIFLLVKDYIVGVLIF